MSSTVTSAVVAVLGRGPAAAAQLVQSLGVSQATISRAVAELERQQQVVIKMLDGVLGQAGR